MRKPGSMLIGVCLLTVAAAAGLNTTVRAAGEDKKIKLNGCLIKAEGDDSYLITNLPSEPGSSGADRTVTTTAIGTAAAYSTIFYWLGGDDELKKHVGHRVEIEGDLKGDLKEGEIKLDRKDNWTELQVKSDGHSMKAKVPNASVFPDPGRDKDRKFNAIVRKVDVDHVRMLGASCD